MKNSVISTILATLFASTVASGTFAQEGEYYEGVSRHHDYLTVTTDSLGIPSVTRYGYPPMKSARGLDNPASSMIDNGDYYDGAVRPQ